MSFNRRNFLKNSGAMLTAASLGGVASPLLSMPALAADTSGYKAIVCLFLFGGMDNHDIILPYDFTSYNEYAAIREGLLNQYDGLAGGSTRDRSRLLPLSPTNAIDFGGRQFALTEEMSGLHSLFENGNAAIVGNVGPLIEPLTRAEFDADTAQLPSQLFSHNDQQATWLTNAPESVGAFGWGGLFADAALGGALASTQPFLSMTTFTSNLFLSGQNAQPYQVSTFGAAEVELLNRIEQLSFLPEGEAAFQNLQNHFLASNFSSTNLFERDIANLSNAAILTNTAYNEAIESAPTLTTQFPTSFLGAQLSTVAQAISVRSSLGASRQVYFVAIGGFDTHSGQVNDLPSLQTEIDAAVSAFYAATQEMAVENDVTLFTASDFGRTLAINGDGTDHGWGAHHFVVGGAVQGQRIFGDIPRSVFDHDLDAGGGRLIPSTSIEQFAEPLGRWFGLNDTEIAMALPRLSNFTGSSPAFV